MSEQPKKIEEMEQPERELTAEEAEAVGGGFKPIADPQIDPAVRLASRDDRPDMDF